MQQDSSSGSQPNSTPEALSDSKANANVAAPSGQLPHHPHHPHQPHQARPHYSAPKFPAAEIVATLDDGTKVKRRVLRMRACDEKDEKGEICSGHLKRWFGGSAEAKAAFGDELYVCERCRVIYLPNLEETPRSGTLAW